MFRFVIRISIEMDQIPELLLCCVSEPTELA